MLVTNALAGLPVVHFDGSNDTLNLPNFESKSAIFHPTFSRCFPISQQERLTNVNLG